jgi:transforming growth factor-beta-induced protein
MILIQIMLNNRICFTVSFLFNFLSKTLNTKIMRSIFKNTSLVAFAMSLFIFTGCKEDEPTPEPPMQKTIAQIAADNGNFTILVDALDRTGLLATVSDPNANLTVFAPTDQAFADLLTELNLADLDAAEAALGTAGLRTVVLYHVLGAKVMSAMVTTGYAATAATNATNDALSLYISTDNGVFINDRAEVKDFDIEASNGVIHVIDKVILPMSVYDLLNVNPDFSALVTALGVADGNLDEFTSDVTGDAFTLFAPTNDGFNAALQELQLADLNALVAALGTDGVAEVLTYHVVLGNVNSDEVPTGAVATVNGENITISTTNGVTITDANGRVVNVTVFDIQGVNGVIHVLDNVLLP